MAIFSLVTMDFFFHIPLLYFTTYPNVSYVLEFHSLTLNISLPIKRARYVWWKLRDYKDRKFNTNPSDTYYLSLIWIYIESKKCIEKFVLMTNNMDQRGVFFLIA
jgi:hypothetical protein